LHQFFFLTGSEDLIDSKSYAMELHMVFYKKNYRNARSAIDHSDGLTVLAFFFEVSEHNNLVYDEFTIVSSILKSLQFFSKRHICILAKKEYFKENLYKFNFEIHKFVKHSPNIKLMAKNSESKFHLNLDSNSMIHSIS
jgi:hypothetical protein